MHPVASFILSTGENLLICQTKNKTVPNLRAKKQNVSRSVLFLRNTLMTSTDKNNVFFFK